MNSIVLSVMLGLACMSVQAADRLKIGYIGTMSGPGALGIESLDGLRLAIQMRSGSLGKLPVEIVVADDQLKPEAGLQAAEKLMLKDKVDLIVGTTFSNVLMSIAKPVTDAGFFLISPNAGPSPLAGAQCKPNFFAVAFLNDQIYEPMGQYLTERGVKRAYLMAPNYQAGKDALAGFKKTFKGQIVDEIYTSISQLDFSAELSRIRAAKPDAVFVFYPGGLAINFVKQYAQLGLKEAIPLYSGFALVDQTVRKAQGDAAVGVFTSGNWSPDLPNPANKRFVEAFKKTYAREPSDYAMFGYDTGLLLDSAIEAVDGDIANKDRFRAALRSAKFESARGGFAFNNNHFPIQDWHIREVVKAGDGDTTLVARAKVYSARADDYGRDCPMKW